MSEATEMEVSISIARSEFAKQFCLRSNWQRSVLAKSADDPASHPAVLSGGGGAVGG
ncbi:hypothetical protein RBSWK_03414 [Rhodopirellula baltica SWK14]|uniref:Uncharacterized protein n=1 Tax=Rhodopirellula baltica SWK14 TaxID=993516 RepID=L7CEH9_RHOBT|nr:hypothetical protein RBSWK_03414 [Rhodopirellula baltica SWK14]